MKNISINIMPYLLAALLCLLSSLSLAQEADDEQSTVYRIERVDHKRNQLLINDTLYTMPISLDIYIFDAKKRKKTKVNRYAMRRGQIVFFKTGTRNQQAYVSEVTIFQP